tara:strand:+ start:281 stop:484 length:204 start_codon:yes stop_codon:yes gene_type:complete
MANVSILLPDALIYCTFLLMNSKDKNIWVTPEVKDLGDAKDIIKGFTPEDPKVPGGGDGNLAGASDA